MFLQEIAADDTVIVKVKDSPTRLKTEKKPKSLFLSSSCAVKRLDHYVICIMVIQMELSKILSLLCSFDSREVYSRLKEDSTVESEFFS